MRGWPHGPTWQSNSTVAMEQLVGELLRQVVMEEDAPRPGRQRTISTTTWTVHESQGNRHWHGRTGSSLTLDLKSLTVQTQTLCHWDFKKVFLNWEDWHFLYCLEVYQISAKRSQWSNMLGRPQMRMKKSSRGRSLERSPTWSSSTCNSGVTGTAGMDTVCHRETHRRQRGATLRSQATRSVILGCLSQSSKMKFSAIKKLHLAKLNLSTSMLLI